MIKSRSNPVKKVMESYAKGLGIEAVMRRWRGSDSSKSAFRSPIVFFLSENFVFIPYEKVTQNSAVFS